MRWMLPILMLITSCTQDVLMPEDDSPPDCMKYCNDGEIDTIPVSPSGTPGEIFTIDTAYLDNQTLHLDVFAGRCVEHCWELNWRGEIYPFNDSTTKTIFVMTDCTNGKRCKDSLKYSLSYDLQFLNGLDTTGSIRIGIEPYHWVNDTFDLLYTH